MPTIKSSKRIHDSDSDAPPAKREKKSKSSSSAPGTVQRGDDGELYWELSTNRRVSITSFKGKSMINIREYYEKDGKNLPGKKGIALPMEQYETLLSLLPQVEEVLKKQGIEVGRPEYGGKAKAAAAEEEQEDEDDGKPEGEEDDEEEEIKPAKKARETDGDRKSKLDRFKFDKQNHEATSDEDD
ncbi:RNA polymerase II transcriptional coactivator-like protein [Elsinoe fawcettii]|nr:RNA polymerase II transcriptional coactivator-like protein [Elsinoe fawcettii]